MVCSFFFLILKEQVFLSDESILFYVVDENNISDVKAKEPKKWQTKQKYDSVTELLVAHEPQRFDEIIIMIVITYFFWIVCRFVHQKVTQNNSLLIQYYRHCEEFDIILPLFHTFRPLSSISKHIIRIYCTKEENERLSNNEE